MLFTVTELANLARVSRNALNVELFRLCNRGIVMRYAQGLYGLPGAVGPEELLPAIDSHAYITGTFALLRHHLITQVPTVITCFTDRRSTRAWVRSTPVGRFELICIRNSIYHPPSAGPIVGPEQALCDFVYLCRREGVSPASQVTFRHLDQLRAARHRAIVTRYPSTVGLEVQRLIAEAPSGKILPRSFIR